MIDEEEFGNKRKNLNEKQKEAETYLNQIEEKVDQIKKTELAKFDKSRRGIFAQKHKVDKYINELLNQLDSKWKSFSQAIEEELSKVGEAKERLVNQKKIVMDVAECNDIKKFFDGVEKFEESCEDTKALVSINIGSI